MVSFPAAVLAAIGLVIVGAAVEEQYLLRASVVVGGGVALLAAAVVHRSARRGGHSSRSAGLLALVTVLCGCFYVLVLFVGLLMSFGFSEM